MLTPWGPSQHSHKITEGVYEVDTAGHGGVMVGTAVATQLLSPAAIEHGWKWGSWYAYEEDCDWAIFAYEQPELYAAARNALDGYTQRTPEETKQIARDTLARWCLDYLIKVEGGELETQEVVQESQDIGQLDREGWRYWRTYHDSDAASPTYGKRIDIYRRRKPDNPLSPPA